MSTILTMDADHPVPPCGKDCPDRAAGCGATCERWKAYEAERAAFYERKNKAAIAKKMSVGREKVMRRSELANQRAKRQKKY